MQTHTHKLAYTGDVVTKTFVETDDSQPEREWLCLSLLNEWCPGVAPRPIERGIDAAGPFVRMQRIPGAPLGGGPLTAEQQHSLAASLRRVFSVPNELARAAGLPERRLGPTTMLATLRAGFSASIDLAPCADPPAVHEALCVARAYLDLPNLPEPQLTTIGIADLNPANVIWDGQRCRLVDFEDGGLTDPAYDVADYLEHLANRQSCSYSEQLVDELDLSDADRDRLAAYRPVFAAFWLKLLLPGHRAFQRNPPGTTERQAERVINLIT